jgi:predicted metal-dependent enzyme (double-stranded beta helix superfamily)
MTTTKRLPAFEKFIQDVRAVWAELPNTERRMKRVKLLLEALVQNPTMTEHSKNWPSTEGHKNLLLYEDRDYQFVVNAVVRKPERDGRIHDHAHAWTAYGVLDGTERLERYRRIDDGKKPNYALNRIREPQRRLSRQGRPRAAVCDSFRERRANKVSCRDRSFRAARGQDVTGSLRCQGE